MNVYLFELKSNLKFMLLWLISIVLLGVIIISFYPLLKDDMAYFITMMNNFPASIRALFGMKLASLDNILGYFVSFPMTFIMLASAISATIIGVTILSKELREKTADFLYAKPISRFNIILSKMLSALTIVSINHLIVTIINLCLLTALGGSINLTNYLLISISIYIVILIFLSLSLFISATFKKLKNPNAVALSIVFAFYALTAFGVDKLRIIIPFKYLSADYILKNSTFEWPYLLLSLSVITLSILGTFIIYQKKDLSTV